jgi:hypothetical protein
VFKFLVLAVKDETFYYFCVKYTVPRMKIVQERLKNFSKFRTFVTCPGF